MFTFQHPTTILTTFGEITTRIDIILSNYTISYAPTLITQLRCVISFSGGSSTNAVG